MKTEESFKKDYGYKIEWTNKKGLLHREYCPAVQYKGGTMFWCINGELHREDGPAVEYNSGSKEWWLFGNEYTEKDYNREIIKIKLKRIKNL